MTPEEVGAVQASLDRVRGDADALADDFYRRLFGDRPGMRHLFPEDMTVQRHKFALELDAIVTAIPDFGAFRDRAGALGARHRGYGVRSAHYALVREHLLAALAAADPQWDTSLAEAWRSAYDLVAALMQSD